MRDAIELLNEIQELMKLKGENPFKIRAFQKAAQNLSGRSDLLERAQAGTLKELPGVGEGIAQVLTEYLLHGRSKVREELLQSLPKGLLELTEIPGLGPKKAQLLIEQLGIESVAELEYACRENRLLKIKGFGLKIQQKILEGISFRNANQGLQRWCDISPQAEKVLNDLRNGLNPSFPGIRIEETGSLRRLSEVLSELHFLVELKEGKHTEARAKSLVSRLQSEKGQILPIHLHFASPDRFGYEWVRTTGTADHWKALGEPKPFHAPTEEEFYKKLGLPWIPPEMRETGEEVALAQAGGLSQILPWNGIKGIFHNHTTWSDGAASLEQMVAAAEEQGYEYIGISDHSQSAFYAQGLKEEDLLKQEKEIRIVQERHPKIRVFWGIESDILADGSLDYGPRILKKFDFVIASIHSRFGMDRQTMTARILKAIQNPYTRFVGHPTGRLLLGRPGYDVDMKFLIEEAAKHDVAIELNANPARLDIDWRWGPTIREAHMWTSIHPDAHEVEGLADTRFGVAMARKALLKGSQVVNTQSAKEVEKWLKRA